MPQQQQQQHKWRLSIVFLFLLLNQSYSSDVTTETTYKDQQPPQELQQEQQQEQQQQTNDGSGDGNYDVVDIAHANANKPKLQTGQTTRIFTEGEEVNDDFWLKHLGEDFHRAIHLQVDGNNGIYNSTQHGPLFDVQHEYVDNNPVQVNEPSPNVVDSHHYPTERVFTKSYNAESEYNNGTAFEEKKSKRRGKSSLKKSDNGESKTNSHVAQEYEEKPFERVFAIDDVGINYKKNNFYNPQTEVNTVTDVEKPKRRRPARPHQKESKIETQNHIKAAPSPSYRNRKTSQRYSGARGRNRGSTKSQSSPVVVNLPEGEKIVHQLDENVEPVVVKMPPIIYHSKPTYTQDDDDSHTPQQEYSATRPQSQQRSYSNAQQQQPQTEEELQDPKQEESENAGIHYTQQKQQQQQQQHQQQQEKQYEAQQQHEKHEAQQQEQQQYEQNEQKQQQHHHQNEQYQHEQHQQQQHQQQQQQHQQQHGHHQHEHKHHQQHEHQHQHHQHDHQHQHQQQHEHLHQTYQHHYQQHSHPYQQQQQQHQQYQQQPQTHFPHYPHTPNYYNTPPFHAEPYHAPDIYHHHSPVAGQILNENSDNPLHEALRFMRKPPRLPIDSFDGYSRVSRSSQDIFKQGL